MEGGELGPRSEATDRLIPKKTVWMLSLTWPVRRALVLRGAPGGSDDIWTGIPWWMGVQGAVPSSSTPCIMRRVVER